MRWYHLAALVGINAIFAGAYLAGDLGVAHFPPLFFSALRFALVALALLPFFRLPRLAAGHAPAFYGFCFCMGIGVYSMMYLGLAAGEGVTAVLIMTQFSVPIAALLGVWLHGDRVNGAAWGGILLALAGALLVGANEALLGYALAALFIFISASFYALANVLSQRLGGVVNVLNLNAWMALLSAPPLLAASFALEDGQWQALASADAASWAVLLYSALVVSLVGHVGMFAMLRRYAVAVVMPYYVLVPIFGVLGGLLFFGETPTAKFYVGATMALCGVWVINKFRKGDG